MTYMFPYVFHMGSNGVFMAEPVSNVIGGSLLLHRNALDSSPRIETDEF